MTRSFIELRRSAKKYVHDVYIQTKALLIKNWRVYTRKSKSSFVIIFAPILFVLILEICLQIPEITESDSHPSSDSIDPLPACSGDPCYMLMYAPWDDDNVNDIMKLFCEQNGCHIVNSTEVPPIDKRTVVSVRNDTTISGYVLANPNVTQGGVIFGVVNQTFIYWELWYNSSCPEKYETCYDYRPQIMTSVSQAILTWQSKQKYGDNAYVNLILSHSDYPSVIQENLVLEYGLLFLYLGLSFFFVIILYQLTYEKENHLRQGLKMIGLRPSSYWWSWIIMHLIVNFYTVLMITFFGWAIRIELFVNTNWFVLFFLFMLYVMVLDMLAIVLSMFINTTKNGITIGIMLYILGGLCQLALGIFSENIWNYIYSDDNGSLNAFLRVILSFFPNFLLSRSLAEICSKAAGPDSLYYNWNDIYDQTDFSSHIGYSTADTFRDLTIMYFVLGIFSWYFDHVIPGTHGTSRKWYFCFTPKFWGLSDPKRKKVKFPALSDNPEPDEDLEEEYQNATRSVNTRVRVVRLGKIYKKRNLFSESTEMKALLDLSLAIEENTIFCLLGHNGAGKTTTINMLTGLFRPTSGDGYLYGHSIVNDMDEVRSLIGVCPQYDILWNQLSAKEHLELFASMKRVNQNEIKQKVYDLLKAVELDDVADHPISTFSGGMKRRLSVAIASIGDPKVIFFDEPTTGMDPKNRRHVWTLIQSLKVGRVVIMTTHSMEEADVLGDRLGIMCNGRLKCVGSSLHLKKKYGSGYRLAVVADTQKNVFPVKEYMRLNLPGCQLLSETSEYLVYLLAESNLSSVSPFFRGLENNPVPYIRDIGISHTTLEDVFLMVVRDENVNYPRRSRFSIGTQPQPRHQTSLIGGSGSGGGDYLRWNDTEQ